MGGEGVSMSQFFLKCRLSLIQRQVKKAYKALENKDDFAGFRTDER